MPLVAGKGVGSKVVSSRSLLVLRESSSLAGVMVFLGFFAGGASQTRCASWILFVSELPDAEDWWDALARLFLGSGFESLGEADWDVCWVPSESESAALGSAEGLRLRACFALGRPLRAGFFWTLRGSGSDGEDSSDVTCVLSDSASASEANRALGRGAGLRAWSWLRALDLERDADGSDVPWVLASLSRSAMIACQGRGGDTRLECQLGADRQMYM